MAAIALVLAALAAPLASASAAAADVETPMLRRGLKFGYGTGEAEVLPTLAPSASAEDGVSYAWSEIGVPRPYEEWSWAHASDTEYSCDATCDDMYLFCACVPP